MDSPKASLVSRLRCTAEIAKSSTDGFTYLNDSCRDLMNEAHATIASQESRIEALRGALEWIARRDSLSSKPELMLDNGYIKNDHVRQLAHDVLSCARSALAAKEGEA